MTTSTLDRRVALGAGRSRTHREAIVGIPVTCGAVAVMLLWVSSLRSDSLSTFGGVLEGLGRTTGLEGTYLALIVVVLLARIPWLDRLVGMDRLAVWHRRAGQLTIVLLVAHAVLIIWGYAAVAHVGVVPETGVLVLSYPDVLAATVGLGLLVAVAVTSARAARRRLSYQTWYFVHLYTYLALALSFAHQLATGDQLSTSLRARVVWAGLYVATLGLVITFRLLVPIRDALRHRLVVDRVVIEGPDVVSIWITGRRLHELAGEAGQFFLWRFVTATTWWQAHPFSLSAAPDGRHLRITVKAAGDHTGWLQRVPPGTRVVAEGPYGAFTAHRRRNRKVLLVGAGSGIAPLRALFETLPAEPGGMVLLFRARSETDLVLRHELEEIARRRDARVYFAVGKRPRSMPWPTADVLQSVTGPDLRHYDAYLCGPPGFMDTATEALRRAGVPRRHIHSEDFAL